MSDQDIAARYASLIQLIAELYADDADLYAYLKSVRVYKDEWDSNRAGGHFWFEADESGPPSSSAVVEALTDDPDGAMISILLHFIGPTTHWGEWFRYDHQPVMSWPPLSVRR